MGDVYNDNIDDTDYKIICNGVEVAVFSEDGLLINGDFDVTGISPENLLFKQNTAIAHTGVTGEAVIATYEITANTIQANDILKWYLNYSTTNNANAKEVKCYFNTSPDISGSPIQVAVRNNVSVVASGIGRELVSLNSQTSQKIHNTSNNLGTVESAGGVALNTISIDFTVTQYFVITANLATGTDTLTLQYLWSKIMR